MGFVEAAKALGAWEEPQPPVSQANSPSGQRRAGTAKEAARRFAAELVGTDFIPVGLHPYLDANGQPIYWMIRARDAKTGDKWIRPMHFDGTRFRLGLPHFERGAKPLYGLDLLAKRPQELVLVCEGEKCADKLRKLGLLAITSGAANSVNRTDWTPVAGRDVLIWPDHDDPGRRYGRDVVERLTEIRCVVNVIDTAHLGLGEGGDVVDWLEANPSATRDAILRLPRHAAPETALALPTASVARAAQPHRDLDVIVRWCSERCVRDSRAWGSIAALYRDLCNWSEPNYAFAPGEFRDLLAKLGIKVDGDFSRGLALECDLKWM